MCAADKSGGSSKGSFIMYILSVIQKAGETTTQNLNVAGPVKSEKIRISNGNLKEAMLSTYSPVWGLFLRFSSMKSTESAPTVSNS